MCMGGGRGGFCELNSLMLFAFLAFPRDRLQHRLEPSALLVRVTNFLCAVECNSVTAGEYFVFISPSPLPSLYPLSADWASRLAQDPYGAFASSDDSDSVITGTAIDFFTYESSGNYEYHSALKSPVLDRQS